jgi:hypothetical protein
MLKGDQDDRVPSTLRLRSVDRIRAAAGAPVFLKYYDA